MRSYDVLIIGAGILGLSTALHLLKRQPTLKVAILEKESRIAAHQTGHNSGVIHSGIYYKPGSLKAHNCREGVKRLYNYLDQKGIPYQQCGKLIIAIDQNELPALKELERRGLSNGVPGLKWMEKDELKTIEPHAAGIAALYSPSTSIVDFTTVAQSYLHDFQGLGGDLFLNEKVIKAGKGYLETESGSYSAKVVVNCAGFHADRIAHLNDSAISGKQIIPFRGEYYELVEKKRSLVQGLIYPVPDPRFPFLGVHLSRTVDGKVEAGPNAVLALAREGYSKKTISLKDCSDYITYRGFWAMAAKYYKIGLYELYRSFSKKAFLKSLQRLIPSLEAADLMPASAGVRSQVVLPDGKLQDDFLIMERPGWIHVLNAPSPAATASLAIGKTIASKVLL